MASWHLHMVFFRFVIHLLALKLAFGTSTIPPLSTYTTTHTDDTVTRSPLIVWLLGTAIICCLAAIGRCSRTSELCDRCPSFDCAAISTDWTPEESNDLSIL